MTTLVTALSQAAQVTLPLHLFPLGCHTEVEIMDLLKHSLS